MGWLRPPRPLSWAACSFDAHKPAGPRTENPTSPIAWCTPSASETPSASAPCSISGATSTSPRSNGRRCALASTTSCPARRPCSPRARPPSSTRPSASPRNCSRAAHRGTGRPPNRPTCNGSMSTRCVWSVPAASGSSNSACGRWSNWACRPCSPSWASTAPCARRRPASLSGASLNPPRSVRRTAGCKRAAASQSCSASTSKPSVRCSSTAPRTRW